MTPTPLAEVALNERPTLFERPTWSEESAAGRLFAPGGDEAAALRRCAAVSERCLGDFGRTLELLTARERERAILLAALVDALLDVAAGPGPADAAQRVADLNRIAFQLARILRGETPESAYLKLLAAEARRRSFTRRALDELFAAARLIARDRRPADTAALDARSRQLGEAVVTALLGAEATPSVVDLAAGAIRLVRLQQLALDLPHGLCSLPSGELPEPLQYRSETEIVTAITRECGALHHLLLKGARAAGEVPLTFRRPVAFLLPVAIALLGLIEEQPRAIVRAVRHVGTWKLRAAFWRARYTPLA